MITAIVLAAGQSVRMGTQKMLLPWGETTVISKVVATLVEAGVSEIYVVTGANHAAITRLIQGPDIHLVINPDYANGEMLTSVQVGLKAIAKDIEATLIVLGDQPQIESQVVRDVLARFQGTGHSLIVPSYRMHRGHPWLLGKSYWEEVLALKPPLTLHDFLNSKKQVIDYMEVDTPSVMQDLDTRQDYSRYKPG